MTPAAATPPPPSVRPLRARQRTDRAARLRRRILLPAALPLLITVSACAGAADTTEASPTDASRSPVREESVGTPAQPTDTSAPALTGLTIALDPGHNGGNGGHLGKINRPVDDGRGGTKACNTTGTATDADYPEHAFTFDVAERTRGLLEEAGARVVMSRSDDAGVGPCVDERGRFAGEQGADLLVSIHANGSESAKTSGFHVIVVKDAVHAGVEEPSRALAEAMVTGLRDADFAPNSAYGADGIVARTDIAGLTHADVPAVLVECGEMRNPQEAAAMESEAGRQRYADALAAGVRDYAAAHLPEHGGTGSPDSSP